MKLPVSIVALLGAVSGCAPEGLNPGQREYLAEDAQLALRQMAPFAAAAFVADLLFDESTVYPADPLEDNLTRIASRFSERMAACAGATAEVVGSSVWIEADCTARGVVWKLSPIVGLTQVDATTLETTLSFALDTVNGVRPAETDVRFTLAEPRLSMANSDAIDVLRFVGTTFVDADTELAVFDGVGSWNRALRGDVAAQWSAAAFGAAECAPSGGAFQLGPREVLITARDAILITQEVTAGTAAGQATVTIDGEAMPIAVTCGD